MKIISWNIARRSQAWRLLASCEADIALLQEAAAPPSDLRARLQSGPEAWLTEGQGGPRDWRAAIVKLGSRIEVEWIETAGLANAQPHQLPVSRMGTLAAARITSREIAKAITVVSVYGLWEKPHASTGGSWLYADASVHRVISDLSSLVATRAKHRIIVAGDLNVLLGYGEHGDPYFAQRYATVFDRFSALGLMFVGPQAPHGRQAFPWPAELPVGSRNVPTYFSSQQNPASATRQLDFVFASPAIARRTTVTALNEAEDWGPSDHCRLEIEIRAGIADA